MHMDSQRVRQVLESKLSEVTNPAGWRDSIAVGATADPADATKEIVEREMAGRSLSRNALQVRELRAALNRLTEGTYGFCVDCDEPISARRLAAVPWAHRCISCQENAEAPVQDERLAA
jgi:DnaK suppressor protein